MAMTPEKKVKNKIVKILKEFDANEYHFYASTGGYGGSGIPDLIACIQGRFVGIEAKAGKNKPTPLQLKNLNEIYKCGGIALCINEDGLEQLEWLLTDALSQQAKRMSFDTCSGFRWGW